MPTQLTLDDAMSGEISAERVREILRLLNDYERTDGPNVFEDVAYGLPEYDGPATEATYPEYEYSFVLADGTRVERSQDQTVPNGLIWRAHRVKSHSEPENTTWQMDENGRAIRWDGKTWREEKE